MREGGELFIVAPGVSRFGEDPVVDALIRRYGYHGRDEALTAMAADPELAANLAAVAHLIHGSTEGRFTVTYAPGPELSRADVEGVGFQYLPLDEALERFPPRRRRYRGPGTVADLRSDRYLEASELMPTRRRRVASPGSSLTGSACTGGVRRRRTSRSRRRPGLRRR
jgi:hypothetical protein